MPNDLIPVDKADETASAYLPRPARKKLWYLPHAIEVGLEAAVIVITTAGGQGLRPIRARNVRGVLSESRCRCAVKDAGRKGAALIGRGSCMRNIALRLRVQCGATECFGKAGRMQS